jgi:hypothetical protein
MKKIIDTEETTELLTEVIRRLEIENPQALKSIFKEENRDYAKRNRRPAGAGQSQFIEREREIAP